MSEVDELRAELERWKRPVTLTFPEGCANYGPYIQLYSGDTLSFDPDMVFKALRAEIDSLRAQRDELAAVLRSIVDKDLTYLSGYVAEMQIDMQNIYKARIALAKVTP